MRDRHVSLTEPVACVVEVSTYLKEAIMARSTVQDAMDRIDTLAESVEKLAGVVIAQTQSDQVGNPAPKAQSKAKRAARDRATEAKARASCVSPVVTVEGAEVFMASTSLGSKQKEPYTYPDGPRMRIKARDRKPVTLPLDVVNIIRAIPEDDFDTLAEVGAEE